MKSNMLNSINCLERVASLRNQISKPYTAFNTAEILSDKGSVILEANMLYNAIEKVISGNYKRLLLNNIVMNRCCFAHCDFQGAAITGSVFRNCYFHNVNFLDVAFHHATFENCILELGNFPYKHVGSLGVKLIGCILLNTSIQNVSLYSALFHNTILYNCEIKTSTFEKFFFDHCSFHNINLAQCNLDFAEVRNIKMHNCTIGANKFPWVVGGMDYIFETNDSINFIGRDKEIISKSDYVEQYVNRLIEDYKKQSALNYKVHFALGNILSGKYDCDSADSSYSSGIHAAQSQNDYRMLNFFSKALLRSKIYTYQEKLKKLTEILNIVKSRVKNINDYMDFANHISEIAIIHTQFSKVNENITGEISFELLISLLNEIQVNFNIGTGVEYDSKDLKNLFELIKLLYECEVEFKKNENVKVQLMLSHKSPVNINVMLSDKSQKLKVNGHKFIEKLKEKIQSTLDLDYEIQISELNSSNTLANKLMEDKKIMEKQTNIIAGDNSQIVNIEGNHNSIEQQNHAQSNINWYNQQEKLKDLKEGELQSLLQATPMYFSMSFLKDIVSVSKRVCKISVKFNNSIISDGTGILIGSNCLLTCDHVFNCKKHPNAKIVSVQLIFGFDNNEMRGVGMDTLTIDLTKTQLIRCHKDDVCFINNITLANNTDLTLKKIHRLHKNVRIMAYNSENTNVAIIHHPLGHSKVVSMAHNKIVKFDERVIQYETDTQPGSSGAPVFDHSLNLIGIHTLGNQFVNRTNTYANAGVSSILINQLLKAHNIKLNF